MADHTVLIVEDEENLLEALKYNLEREGHHVLTAGDGERGLEMARQSHPNLVILDVMLPKLDGLEVCRLIRRDSDVPVLMLTAKGEEVDRVVGLEIGADDYVTKPFSMRELMARVRAMLRRPRATAPTDRASGPKEILRSDNLEIDLESHSARLDGRPLDLKPREFDLLTMLVENKGRAFTRAQILHRLWDEAFIGDARTVDVHVRWLREKIESDPGSPRRIITIRGVGYRFEK